ncbi:MAG TPA: glycerophosphodiester phosphodiesterase [Solirubrobacteraceae bacterium]|nr:glycerophosphodiester phosphodiesterase [Solirubrobacteraceae bacterium]
MSAGPLIVAHRGAWSHAQGRPQNSLAAFAHAVALGCEMVEFDVRRTADGELVAVHDELIGGVAVGAQTARELTERMGRRPDALADVLHYARGHIALDMELKEPGYVEQVLAAVSEARFPAERMIVTSFLDDVLAEVRERAPALRTGLLLGTAHPSPHLRTRLSELSPETRARECGATYIAPHLALARLGAVRRGTAAGFPALVWTVNRAAELRTLLADSRVAGVITDAPERALALRDGSVG